MTLSKALKELIIKNPFYGMFLLNFNKKIVDDSHPIKTAAVGLDGMCFILYININFWNKLTDPQQLSILTHEAMHVCFFHLTNLYKGYNHHNMNIANDCEINCYINNLPDDAITPNSLSNIINEKLEPKKGSIYYYNKIMNFARNNPDKCLPDLSMMSLPNMDDHSIWPKDLSEAEKSIIDNQIKYKIKETSDNVKRGRGHLPGEIQELLKLIEDKPPIYNWKKEFKQLIGNSISFDIVPTRLRPNKRFKDAKGLKLTRKPEILIGVDTSGSIGKDDANDFFSEIHNIYKTGIDITIAECDTKINKIFKYTGSDTIEFVGRGGTKLIDIINYYKKHKNFSCCVLFTDGYCEKSMPLCRNLIWIISKNGDKSSKYSPGKIILMSK